MLNMKIVISGANGFIGSNLVNYLTKYDFQIIEIGRSDIALSPEQFSEKINNAYAVINLSGASISKRWTRKHKREIYTSRINTTRKIVDAIRLCDKRPEILINASAIGIYDNIHSHHEESNFIAYDYLSKVIKDWEHCANVAMEFGVSVSLLRLGIVLGKDGGMLKKILPVFRKGLGGKIGNGKQKFSFIHIDDLTGVVSGILNKSISHGVYNVVAPENTTNREFTIELARALKTSAFFNIPSWFLTLLFGEGAKVLMDGQHVIPAKLIEKGFIFKYPDMKSALEEIVKK